jgi:hypothetical protein
VVEGDDPVVEADDQRRRPQVVGPRAGDALDAAVQVVAEQPGRPALERRQPGQRLGGVAGEQRGDGGERVGVAVGGGLDGEPAVPEDPVVGGVGLGERLGGEERVAAEGRAGGGAVEEQRRGAVQEPAGGVPGVGRRRQLLGQRHTRRHAGILRSDQ